MKLTWGIVVILAAALGVAGGYRLALAREHQRLEKNKQLVRLAFRWISGENKEARDKMAHLIYADKFTVHDWLGDRTSGPDGMADEASETHTDFSGWSEHPEIIVAEGDYVAVRSWAGGKQAKDFDATPTPLAGDTEQRPITEHAREHCVSHRRREASGRVGAQRWVGR